MNIGTNGNKGTLAWLVQVHKYSTALVGVAYQAVPLQLHHTVRKPPAAAAAPLATSDIDVH